MRKIRTQLGKSFALLSASVFLGTPAFAAVVYDNSANSLNQSYAPVGATEFGDEIVLSGTDRIITDFRFEYYLSSTSGNETGQLRIYANDGGGADPAPQTLLYESAVFGLETGFRTAIASGLNVPVPDSFTWTITFSGIDGEEQAGLVLYDPPSIGQSFNDFWQRTDGTWNLATIDGGQLPANFGARITAVPEPSTYALILLAGLGWLGFRGFRRNS